MKIIDVRRRRKQAKQLLLTFLMFFTVFSFLAWPNLALSREDNDVIEPNQTVEITVKQGDTLWNLAKKYGNPDKDVRWTIAQIKKCNGLAKKQYIQPGQTLIIPLE